MLLISWGHLAAIYSSAQASINNNNNKNSACNPCDPVSAYSALSDLHDHKQWEFGSLLAGESQPSSHKHCSLPAALLKAPWISSATENLSSWAGFWDPSHMSEDPPLSTDPLGNSLTAPSSIPCFQLMATTSHLAHKVLSKATVANAGLGYNATRLFVCLCQQLNFANLWCMYQMTLATRRVL